MEFKSKDADVQTIQKSAPKKMNEDALQQANANLLLFGENEIFAACSIPSFK